MKKNIRFLLNEEYGQGFVEYGLIIMLAAVAAIAGVMLLGPKVSSLFESINF